MVLFLAPREGARGRGIHIYVLCHSAMARLEIVLMLIWSSNWYGWMYGMCSAAQLQHTSIMCVLSEIYHCWYCCQHSHVAVLKHCLPVPSWSITFSDHLHISRVMHGAHDEAWFVLSWFAGVLFASGERIGCTHSGDRAPRCTYMYFILFWFVFLFYFLNTTAMDPWIHHDIIWTCHWAIIRFTRILGQYIHVKISNHPIASYEPLACAPSFWLWYGRPDISTAEFCHGQPVL